MGARMRSIQCKLTPILSLKEYGGQSDIGSKKCEDCTSYKAAVLWNYRRVS